jgi:hypothetical protein
MHGTTAFAEPRSGATCADCGTPAAGNFCSSCGADLREHGLAIFGLGRRSFPAVYLQLLSAPIQNTVGLAEDKTYRTHLSFLLTSLAIFCLLMLPTLFGAATAAGPAAHVSESMQSVMRILSQVGAYIGTAITFLIAYGLFRYFSRELRSLPAPLGCYRHILTQRRDQLDPLGPARGRRCAGAVGLLHRHPPALLALAAVEGGRALRGRRDVIVSAELLADVRRRPGDGRGFAR